MRGSTALVIIGAIFLFAVGSFGLAEVWAMYMTYGVDYRILGPFQNLAIVSFLQFLLILGLITTVAGTIIRRIQDSEHP